MDELPPECGHHPTDYCVHPDREGPLTVLSVKLLKCKEVRNRGECPLGYVYPFEPISNGADGEGPVLKLMEGDTVTEFNTYMELLDHVITQTFEICVNSPEEETMLSDVDRSRLEAVHNAFL